MFFVYNGKTQAFELIKDCGAFAAVYRSVIDDLNSDMNFVYVGY